MNLNPARSAALAGLTVQAELDSLWLTRQPSRNVFYRAFSRRLPPSAIGPIADTPSKEIGSPGESYAAGATQRISAPGPRRRAVQLPPLRRRPDRRTGTNRCRRSAFDSRSGAAA